MTANDPDPGVVTDVGLRETLHAREPGGELQAGDSVANALRRVNKPVVNREGGDSIVPNSSGETINAVGDISHNLGFIVRKDCRLSSISAMDTHNSISNLVDVKMLGDSELLGLVMHVQQTQ